MSTTEKPNAKATKKRPQVISKKLAISKDHTKRVPFKKSKKPTKARKTLESKGLNKTARSARKSTSAKRSTIIRNVIQSTV